jgi:hypothetical protein
MITQEQFDARVFIAFVSAMLITMIGTFTLCSII